MGKCRILKSIARNSDTTRYELDKFTVRASGIRKDANLSQTTERRC